MTVFGWELGRELMAAVQQLSPDHRADRADLCGGFFVFRDPDGTTTAVSSPDPGRALITGDGSDPIESVNAFKIPSLWGVSRTAPYFHDNSAKTLEDVLRHYAQFFAIVTDPSIDGDPPLILTERDQADIIAFMKLLR